MMTQAFYTGVAGLRTNSYGIDAVSDNLANISTIGYRGYGIEFSSMFEGYINTNSGSSSVDSTIGVGSQIQATPMITSTGTLQLSQRNTDLAIDGDGWFGAKGDGNPIYTRDGAFTFDANADLITIDGFHVLGTMAGNISEDDVLTSKLDTVPLGEVNTQKELRFPKTLSYPPEPTTNVSFIANLGILDVSRTVSGTAVDGNNSKNHLKLDFTKNAIQTLPGSQWSATATMQSLDGGTIYDVQTGSLEFDSRGALISNTLTSVNNNGTEVAIDLGSNFDGVISIDVPIVAAGSSSSNGTIGGDLIGYAINKNAEVLATFSNGEQSVVGRVAVYHFQNDQGLSRLNGSRFAETINSGKAAFAKDTNGNSIVGADITNFKLEGSNYQITQGLTELIVLQRAYDASSKLVTTADEMIQKAINM